MSEEEKQAETPAAETAEAPAPVEVQPLPTFGGFGAAGGATGTPFQFGSFSAVPTPAAPAEGGDDEPAKEEECSAEYAPVCELAEVETVTGEEDEDILHEVKAKLYRFAEDEWKERGLGVIKLLQHKETKKCRLLMRRAKTLKICANQAVQAQVNFEEHAGNEKAWVWSAYDFADGENTFDMLAIRFGSVEKAQEFKAAYEAVQKDLPPAAEAPPTADATEGLADAVEAVAIKEPEAEEPKAEEA